MYCANCGVKLADSEKKCPLCGLTAFHPEIQRPEGQRLYPAVEYQNQQVQPWFALIILTAVFLLPLLTVLIADYQLTKQITWSGYVVGALLVVYTCTVLPSWFKHPNPVIFVPCGFAAVGLYLLYINYATHGSWFLTFAFPVAGAIMLIVTAVIALLRYVRRGKLYIFGGAAIGLGAFMPVMELLLVTTFQSIRFTGWSFYPLLALALLGGLLIFLAIFRPARETMERKFFI